MDITLKNYSTTIPAALLKKAEKDIVRELDEVEKGHYQAYVDEKSGDSFDVLLNLDSKGAVTRHKCECKVHPDFCRHNAAVLIAIAWNKKVAPPIKKIRKKNTLDAILDDLDGDRLRAWVKDLLTKNKDIEIAFLHQFSATEKVYTPEAIMQQTQDAVKAVIRNKKTVEVSEIKRILDLWTELHTPVADAYIVDVTNEAAFLNLHAIIEAWEALRGRLKSTSSRFNKYIDGMLAKAVAPIQGLHSDELWNKTTGYFIDRLIGNDLIRGHYLLFLYDLYQNETTDRKKWLVEQLVQHHQRNNPHNVYNGAYTETIFKIVTDAGVFDKHYRLFQPGHFTNEYNERLIRQLIGFGYLKLAEQYSREQIKRNYRPEYNALYMQLLTEIIYIK